MSKAKAKARPQKARPAAKKPAAKPAKGAKPALKHAPKPAPRVAPKPAPKLPSKGVPKGAPKPAPKLASRPATPKPVEPKSIMESAQHIWLAGLGAFAKAQGEGGNLFQTLLKEGASLEQKTRKIATGTAGDMRDAVESGVSQVRERTQETWDRLEQVFESRVSRALAKLGVPGRKELDDLLKRVDELGREMKRAVGLPPRSSLSQVMSSTVRRARDDLSDLARELEEAQLAAKQQMKRTVAKVKKTIKTATR
jgi:poly(hydroxyalkanoate) granule-associated protein